MLLLSFLCVTYQPITIADGHRGLRHVCHISSEDTVSTDMLLAFLLKVFLPLHKSPRGHQPPVGFEAKVKLLPKNCDIEKQVLSCRRGGRGHLRGTTSHPSSSSAAAADAAKARGSIGTFTSTSSRDHVRNVPAVGVCAERHNKTILS